MVLERLREVLEVLGELFRVGVVGWWGVKLLFLMIVGGVFFWMMEELEKLLDVFIVKLRVFEEKNEVFEVVDWVFEDSD